MTNGANPVAAVYDRRRKGSDGHRPPLQVHFPRRAMLRHRLGNFAEGDALLPPRPGR
ncbi:MAG: hypothetical protein HY360_12690 [Verrucomicrobia bacterium]|nr:hypothetical protein [Verrucomicrobiota bacterium]